MKEDLTDITFLIPIRIDSEERLLNIEIILKFLLSYYDTNIIVVECDSMKRMPENLVAKVSYMFMKTSKKIFYRTKINNLLIKFCSTKYAVLYDCDVIIPICQMIDSVKTLRSGLYDFSMPYDGTFIQVDKYNKRLFKKTNNFYYLHNGCNVLDVDTYNSAGGCFVFRVNEYLKCGLENENIIGWGHDDIERKQRIAILGHSVYRPKGYLYHLYHERNENSRFFNYKFAYRSYREYLSICKLDKNELERRIREWAWLK